MKNELIEKGQSQEESDRIKITTNSIFKKQFQFPEVSKNDFSTELFEELEISEKNLNSNLENTDNYSNFIKTAEEVRKKLKDKYGDGWTDPLNGGPPTLV